MDPLNLTDTEQLPPQIERLRRRADRLLLELAAASSELSEVYSDLIKAERAQLKTLK